MVLGDQIYVYRNLYNLEQVYEHHGIDCGDNTVIHYRKPSEIIERTSWETFSKGNRVYIKEYARGFCYLPHLVVTRAQERLGENQYNLFFNNCEHFATWCKTGINHSKQISELIPALENLNKFNLYESLEKNLYSSETNKTKYLLNKALADIKIAWEQIQPQYQQSLQEIDSWEKVAIQAVKQNRDDLARAALIKKSGYQQKAKELEVQLQQLANMTENLIRNSQNLQ